jgi:hypothetical protein
MCIYLGEDSNLHYDSADHIIPAGLGGKTKLPLNYVSREFNNLISRSEQVFLRNSIISMPRQIIGPGKRGSSTHIKATKSLINVFKQQTDKGSLSLGYIQLGKPVEIPHIVLNSKTGDYSVGLNKETVEEEFPRFKQKLFEFDKLKIRKIKFKDLDSNTFLLGIKEGVEENYDCFIASSDGMAHPFNAKALAAMADALSDRNALTSDTPYKIRTYQNAVINDDYFRCCAKISFNCLVHLKGKEFVLQDCFNPLRNWIVNGGENEFVRLSPSNDFTIHNIFPEDSHWIIISKVENTLVANICFYNHFQNLVQLSKSFTDYFPLNGFVCDWKNKREFDYAEYMIVLSNRNKFKPQKTI